MLNKKIAIIQNRIIKGGRFQVIAGLVKVLNEEGIVPDIVTLKSRVSKDEAENFYGDKIEFNLKEICLNPRIPYDFNILFFNLIVRFYLKEYALVINSSNSSFLLPGRTNIISYVHYPRKDRLMSKKVSIHFPEGEEKQWSKPSHIYDNLAAFLYKFNKRLQRNESVIANSDFTKKAVSKSYGIDESGITVIYPPVWQGRKTAADTKKNYRMVCSAGRFAEDKRQFEQIQIAEKLPGYHFHIMGFAKPNDPYLNICENYIRDKGVSNVTLYPNINFEKMNNIFSEAGFFIHSLRNEPFGVVTVQAIENGCIPIVHNSGGQKEIVDIEELRYNNVDEAINIFKRLGLNDKEKLYSYVEKLASKAQDYSYSYFCEQFQQIFAQKL